MNCRHCNNKLNHLFADLHYSPPSNRYLTPEQLSRPEVYYPLRVQVCDNCWLVQTEDYVESETDGLFDENYAYFSSTSSSFLEHAKIYCEKMISRFSLNSESLVIEIASNDGYLLKNFIGTEINTIGIEPTKSTAEAAKKIGINVIQDFFGVDLANKLLNDDIKSDLIIGNNVYAHIPDINDFTQGMKLLLKKDGVITLEMPHLLELLKHSQFDTIYHEHFSYHSLYTIQKIFKKHGLRIFDVDVLETHGGSLRVYGCLENASHIEQSSVSNVLEDEKNSGLQKLDTYNSFQPMIDNIKINVIEFLIEKKKEGKTVVAYGAAAKGNTLLNYCGIKSDLITAVFDAAEAKQGKFLPGSHIPILDPKKIKSFNPDYVIILPWNIADEVMNQNKELQKDGIKFVIAVPELKIL
ncbi:MAG: class I SAM-dependent methyltransferase [Gammaproteobacteria bacterium]|tara:strand:- start:56 stop:1285 length:1230 start_codon:yes stop_codon:yes gene_type:complete